MPLPLNAVCPYLTCPNPRSKTSDIVNATKLTGIEFELFVKHQLIKSGYVKVETTRQSGDMGADLLVRENGKLVVVQCKRCAGTIGVSAVQEVLGAKSFYKAQEAWVVTDSTFTKAARELRKAPRVGLRGDGRSHVNDYGLFVAPVLHKEHATKQSTCWIKRSKLT
jgi:restriction system protein